MEAFEASRDYLAMERFGSSMRAMSNSGEESVLAYSAKARTILTTGTHTPTSFIRARCRSEAGAQGGMTVHNADVASAA